MQHSILVDQINALLITNGWSPRGTCACKGRPYRWTKDGYQFKLYADRWIISHGINTIRFGSNETVIAEVTDYLAQG